MLLMQRLRNCLCYRNRHRLLLLFLAALGGRFAEAYDYKLVLAPPAQSNNSTCQSYALATALSMLQPPSQVASYEWGIENVNDLRRNEMTIRGAIEREMKKRLNVDNLSPNDESIRDDWKKAIKKLTFGQYEVANKYFLSLDEMIEFLKDKVPVRSKINTLAPYIISTPTTFYFTSFRRVEESTYAGHIVSIIGVDADEQRYSSEPVALLLVNSYVKGDDNECLPKEQEKGKYYGSAGWTNNYMMKQWGGKYILSWIEEKK